MESDPLHMQTLIPEPVTATARYSGRSGRVFGFGLTARALLLLLAGVLWSIPAFFHPGRLWLMLAWDALIAGLILFDVLGLPRPSAVAVTRRFLASPTLGERTEIEYEVVQSSNRILNLRLTDDLHPALDAQPQPLAITAYPRDAIRATHACYPRRRGDIRLGRIYLQYSCLLYTSPDRILTDILAATALPK